MKLLTYLSSTIIALSLSAAVNAQDLKSPHSVGLQLGGGDIEYKGQEGENVGTSYLYYNYQFSTFYSLELGLLGGKDTDWECRERENEWRCFSDNDRRDRFELQADDLELGAFVIAIKTDLALSQRNKLYGKIGLSYYDYELDFKEQNIADEDGVGYMFEGGWQYRWDMGLGMNAGLQHNRMDDLKSTSLQVGINYAF